MPFLKGNKLGKGRPKKPKAQVKDWIKDHPYAVATLMEVLYAKGKEGDRESATYVIDRIKGKPKQQTDIDIKGGSQLGTGLVVELFKILTEKQKQLKEGDYAIQGQREEEGSFKAINGEEEEGVNTGD